MFGGAIPKARDGLDGRAGANAGFGIPQFHVVGYRWGFPVRHMSADSHRESQES